MSPKHGVVSLPPSAISESIRKEVNRALAEIPEGKTGLMQVDISLEQGVNIAYAMKTPKGWEAVVYVGKHWDGDLVAGARVKKVW